MHRGWFVMVGLAGCGGIEAQVDYEQIRADAECAQLERCSLGFFDATYGSQKDCAHDVQKILGDTDDQFQSSQCDYDPDEAGRCVRRLRGLSCEDYAEGEETNACDLVWTCTSGPRTYYPTYAGGV